MLPEDLIHHKLHLVHSLVITELLMLFLDLNEVLHCESVLSLVASSYSYPLKAYSVAFIDLRVKLLNVDCVLR